MRGSLPSWSAVAVATSTWTALRQPRASDVPLVLYRDANAWCPFSHRCFFFMEERGLRYTTTHIHLGGDPREPPKQAEYLRDVAPRGNVPALRIRGEVVLESLDILRALDREFPGAEPMTAEDRALEARLIESCGTFDSDCDAWLHNVDSAAEAALHAEAIDKLRWLETALGARPAGPFLLGERVTVADAAFVGFLTRLAANYAYFKGLDVRDPTAGYPRLAVWLDAIDNSRGGRATRQEAFFEQRIYQAHPERRPAAEPCMALHPKRRVVGEPHAYSPPPLTVARTLTAGSDAALEAAERLRVRCDATARFLLRKQREASAPPPARHWKMAARRPPAAPAPPPDPPEALEAVHRQLLALASLLCGQCSTADAVVFAGGGAALREGPVAQLGALVATPRDMTVAAAAELRADLTAMLASTEE